MPRSSRSGRPPHPDALTPAEWRVVEAVRHGLTNPDIAARLGVGIDAVKFHVGNALGKLGFDSRAELRQWNGVRKDSALNDRAAPDDDAAASIELAAIGQIARLVRDVAAAERWYADVLGLRHLYSFGTLAFFDCGGTRLLLSQGDPAANSILYFRVGDIVAAAAALRERGVAFIAAPHQIHRHADGSEEWMAFFHDLDGATLALMAVTPPTPQEDDR